MNLSNDLIISYKKVGCKTWENNDFLYSNLKSSINIFEKKELDNLIAIPKKMDVIGVLSGLPFSVTTQSQIVSIQNKIKLILANTLAYYVEKNNLGIEYFVFKWPKDNPLEKIQIDLCCKIFEKIVKNYSSYQILISGIQINPDGCILAKGFPLDNNFHSIRELIEKNYPYKSSRLQSEWMHIPLGRILSPVGIDKFRQLKALVKSLEDFKFKITIDSIHLIHEHQWYMCEREYINSSKL